MRAGCRRSRCPWLSVPRSPLPAPHFPSARLYLGQNWSATATIKQDHELIRRGPYRLVRHPIYTGTLIAAAGTAIAFGELRDLLALPLVIVGFWLKARSEERLLMSNFGDRYAADRREVRGAIIPYLL